VVIAARVRSPPGDDTREVILATAERLFAEQGVAAVSSRQVSEAAGQGNNSAVAYHFGSKADLVRAIVRRHEADVELRRARMVAALRPSSGLRDWLSCLVRPITGHLDALGSPSWYARFLAQATTDPAFRQMVIDESVASASMKQYVQVMGRLIRALPVEVRGERGDMCRHLIAHTCAERERALHAGQPTPRATWNDAAAGLVDALVGLWRAKATRRRRGPNRRRS
jgi:AcrR family transcriptional regulator